MWGRPTSQRPSLGSLPGAEHCLSTAALATPVQTSKAEAGAAYKKWAKFHKMRVPTAGEDEGGGPAGGGPGRTATTGLADRFKRGGRGWKNPFKARRGFMHCVWVI